jgi:hypothetical protein
MRFIRLVALSGVIAALVIPRVAVQATDASPAATAEKIRGSLFNAQVALNNDPAQASILLNDGQNDYSGDFAETIGAAAPEADARLRAGLEAASRALAENNLSAFAAARAQHAFLAS